MTSPSEENLIKKSNVDKILRNVDLGELVTKFEFLGEKTPEQKEGFDIPMGLPPNIVGVYQNSKRIGAIYFLKDPIEIVAYDPSFKPYMDNIKKEMNQ